MKLCITRQHYLTGELFVEISIGGLDYTNPNALIKKYDGEFEEFLDPIKAIESAINIKNKWQKESNEKINLEIGFTNGCTIPFEPITEENAKKWAQQAYNELPKCVICGKIVNEDTAQTCVLANDNDLFCPIGNCVEVFIEKLNLSEEELELAYNSYW